jgi:hypothetical protein
MNSCVKLVPVGNFQALTLTEDGFGLDTELTARPLRGGVGPFEIPVHLRRPPSSRARRSVGATAPAAWRSWPRSASSGSHRVLPPTGGSPAVLRVDVPVGAWRVSAPIAELPAAIIDRAGIGDATVAIFDRVAHEVEGVLHGAG